MPRPKVIIVQPQYASACPESTFARFAATDKEAAEEDRVDLVTNVVAKGSILVHSFNQLLANALDHRDRGNATHMAMLHDDIWPQGPWVTDLWREMRTHNADLVSAVVPIKDQPYKRTSTAIGTWLEPWEVVRYIGPEDRNGPQTFGSEDCQKGEVLLVNTGCFLADLRHKAWDHFAETGGFRFRARIEKDPASGQRVAQVQSEDWLMSRYLQEHGCKVMATWAVHVRHGGWAWWDSRSE